MQCTMFILGHNTEPDVVDLLEKLEIVENIGAEMPIQQFLEDFNASGNLYILSIYVCLQAI